MTTGAEATPSPEAGLYRKTATITATQWWKDGDHPAVRIDGTGNPVAWINTLEGGHIVSPGDWIATGVRGEHWPIKPDIFAATYELVEEPLDQTWPECLDPNAPHNRRLRTPATADRAEKAEALLRECRPHIARIAGVEQAGGYPPITMATLARINAHLAGEPGQGDEARAALSETRP